MPGLSPVAFIHTHTHDEPESNSAFPRMSPLEKTTNVWTLIVVEQMIFGNAKN